MPVKKLKKATRKKIVKKAKKAVVKKIVKKPEAPEPVEEPAKVEVMTPEREAEIKDAVLERLREARPARLKEVTWTGLCDHCNTEGPLNCMNSLSKNAPDHMTPLVRESMCFECKDRLVSEVFGPAWNGVTKSPARHRRKVDELVLQFKRRLYEKFKSRKDTKNGLLADKVIASIRKKATALRLKCRTEKGLEEWSKKIAGGAS